MYAFTIIASKKLTNILTHHLLDLLANQLITPIDSTHIFYDNQLLLVGKINSLVHLFSISERLCSFLLMFFNQVTQMDISLNAQISPPDLKTDFKLVK